MSSQEEDLTDEIEPLTERQKSDLSAARASSRAKKFGGKQSSKRSRKKSGSGNSKLGNNKSTRSATTSRKHDKSSKPNEPQKSNNMDSTSRVNELSSGFFDSKDAKGTAPDTSESKNQSVGDGGPVGTSDDRQPDPTKRPLASANSKLSQQAGQKTELDSDNTDVVDIESELTNPKQGLLDRLLDTKSDPLRPDTERGHIDELPAGLEVDSQKSKVSSGSPDDLFSNLNRVAASDTSSSGSSSDDFEDLLLGGLSGADTSKIIQSQDRAGQDAQRDHERLTRDPTADVQAPQQEPDFSADAARRDALKKNLESSSSRVVPGTLPASSDTDITAKVSKDEEPPLGTNQSRPASKENASSKVQSGLSDAEKNTATHDVSDRDAVEPKEPTKAGNRSSHVNSGQRTERDDPNPPKSETKTGGVDNSSRSSETEANKASNPKKNSKRSLSEHKVAKPTAVDAVAEPSQNAVKAQKSAREKRTVDMSSEAKQVSAPPPLTEPTDGFQSSTTKTETDSARTELTSEADDRSRGFKVSTETVKQTLRPPARVRARKVRRVVRHVDPWSVLTFSVLFHLTIFSSLLLGAVLIWQVADAAGIIENVEDIIKDLGSYEQYQLNGWAVFRAGVAIAGIFTLASTVLVVILAVIFNLISDLVGGIRLTVVQEETVRVQRDK